MIDVDIGKAAVGPEFHNHALTAVLLSNLPACHDLLAGASQWLLGLSIWANTSMSVSMSCPIRYALYVPFKNCSFAHRHICMVALCCQWNSVTS